MSHLDALETYFSLIVPMIDKRNAAILRSYFSKISALESRLEVAGVVIFLKVNLVAFIITVR